MRTLIKIALFVALASAAGVTWSQIRAGADRARDLVCSCPEVRR